MTGASRPPRPPPWPRCRTPSRNAWPRASCATGSAPARPTPCSPPGGRRRTPRPARRCCAIRAPPRRRLASPRSPHSAPPHASSRPASSRPSRRSKRSRSPAAPSTAKLAPYHALIKEQAQQGLRSPRILREIRARGYTGGLTILKAFLRSLGLHPPRPPRVFRRFETRPGEEAQSDWSPYRVLIASRATIVHAFSLILCFSRRLFVDLFRDERLPTLLWAHQEAFRYHQGLCRPFASWDDLHAQCREWLDTVANVRVHGTTRRRVDEAFAEEQPCLIVLPSVSFPSARQEPRVVQKDGYIPVDGSYYPLPEALLDRGPVNVRIDPRQVHILDAAGQIVASHRVPETPTRIPAPAPPPGHPRAALSRSVHEAAFLARFPHARAFLDGLAHRMTTLTPIHLRAIEQLMALYGQDAVQDALERAAAYRNFNAHAVERILQRAHPTVVPEPALGALSPRPEAFGALDDTDPGSLHDSTLDSMPPTGGPDHDA